jgi:uncharacterized protein (DUF111 family)
LKDVPIYGGEVKGELCTPTGAALLKHFATRFGEMPVMAVQAVGYGMGKKDFPAANCVRAFLADSGDLTEEMVKLECNLDDMTGEELGFALERLMDAGARDAFYTPVFMKKNRPGWLLTVLCAPDEADRFTALLFRHTTTLGVRRSLLDRAVLPRSFRTVPTPWGDVPVKEAGEGDNLRLHPEYDAIARIAREHNLPLRTVSQAALSSLPR